EKAAVEINPEASLRAVAGNTFLVRLTRVVSEQWRDLAHEFAEINHGRSSAKVASSSRMRLRSSESSSPRRSSSASIAAKRRFIPSAEMSGSTELPELDPGLRSASELVTNESISRGLSSGRG